MTPHALSGWLPWLGGFLAATCFLVLLETYSITHRLDVFDDTHSGILYGPMGLMLLLGILTVRYSLRGIDQSTALRIVWASAVVQIGTHFLVLPWDHPGKLVRQSPGTLSYLAVLLAAPCLLGIGLLRREDARAAREHGRLLAKVLAAGLCVLSLVTGVYTALSYRERGFPPAFSWFEIVDSLLIMASTGVLAWACVEELRPIRDGDARIPRLFSAMMSWLLVTTLHEAFGICLSVFLFRRPFVEALPRDLPHLLWVLILSISTASALTTSGLRYNSESSDHP